MQYEFDKIVDRTNMASIRELTTPEYVTESGFVSFWGAEFEFKTAPCVIEAIKAWADKGLAAYGKMDDALRTVISNWMKYRRNWEIEKEWIVDTYGLTNSVGTICRAFTNPGDGVIGMSPVYHVTWDAVLLNDRVHIDCPLLFDGADYHIDYVRLEQLMADEKNKVLDFCNPHNPIAKVWKKEDLMKIAELAYRYDVLVYSDEIFADTVYEGVEMLTFSQVTDIPVKTIIATSLGKTFSMTGIGQANMIIKDEEVRKRFIEQRDKEHYGSFNPMMRAAYFGGYTKAGSDWVDALMKYCYRNYRYFDEFCKQKLPEIQAIRPEGSYILWADCRKLSLTEETEYEKLFGEAAFMCDHGNVYGSEPGFIRVNLAAPQQELIKVLDSLEKVIHK